MFAGFEANPGRLYVVATLLPLGAFALLLVGGGVRAMCRPFRMTYRVVTADGQTLMGLKIKEDAKEVLLREANGRDTRIDKENIESIAPKGGFAGSLYWICGGDKPLKTGAYLATACMVVTAILAVTGLVWFLSESGHGGASPHWAERTDWVRIGPPRLRHAGRVGEAADHRPGTASARTRDGAGNRLQDRLADGGHLRDGRGHLHAYLYLLARLHA